MGYTADDLRSQLSPAPTGRRSADASVAPQYFEFAMLEPDEVSDRGTKSWYVRSQSCCVVFSLVRAGERLRRDEQPDEYMVLLPSADSSAVVTAGGESHEVVGRTVVVVPPGTSEVAAGRSGVAVRLFSNRAQDVLDRCRNAEVYKGPDPNVRAFAPWPHPPDGPRVRVYGLDAIEPDSARFGRLLRCSTLMVNYFYPDDAPRDPSTLSPHHHDDFEQISLQLEGDYVHHMRTPWTVDMNHWRDDEHRLCTSPAVTIIPPPTIHTSQAVHHMPHVLVDVFCPPRADFSERPGWVVNHDEYPMP